MRRILPLCLFLLTTSLASASEEKVLAILQPVADATIRGDFTAGVAVMYDPVAKDFGGKEALAAAAETVKAQLEAQKIKMIRFDLLKPVHFVKTSVRKYVIVKTATDAETPKGTIRMHGFQFGVEVEPGKWQFLDGARTTKDVVEKYFPDFPKSEKLPERRHEMLAPPTR